METSATTMDTENCVECSVKVQFDHDIRRFAFCGTFTTLCTNLQEIYSFPNYAMLVVKYLDDDKEWITMSSHKELLQANSIAQASNDRILRLSLSTQVSNETPSHSPARDYPTAVYQPRFNWKQQKKEFKEYSKSFKHQSKGAPYRQIRFVKDVTIPEKSQLNPGTEFTKIWRIRNESESPLPSGCSVRFKKGDNLGGLNAIVSLNELAPRQEIDLSINLVAPSDPGRYRGVWRLTGPFGKHFGPPLAVDIRVLGATSSSSSSEEEPRNPSTPQHISWGALLEKLDSMGFTDRGLNVRLLRKKKGDLDKVVVKLLKKQSKQRHYKNKEKM